MFVDFRLLYCWLQDRKFQITIIRRFYIDKTNPLAPAIELLTISEAIELIEVESKDFSEDQSQQI